MDAPGPIADDEIILRRVPPGTYWQAPGPRVTSSNFELRPGEAGVSVTRSAITTPAALLAIAGRRAEDGWRVAAASAAQIRSLGLEVVPKPLPDDPGHSEIESDVADLGDLKVRRALAKLFQFVDTSSSAVPSS